MDLKLAILFETADRISAPFRNMGKSADGLRERVKDTAQTLKSLDDTMGKIEAFRRFKSEVHGNADALKEAQAAAAMLADEIGKTDHPTKAMWSGLHRVNKEVEKLSEKQMNLGMKSRQMREELQQAGINTDDLAAAKADLTAKMDAAAAAAAREGAALKKLNEQTHAQAHALHKADVARDNMMRKAASLSFAGQASMAAGRGILDRLGSTLEPLRRVEKVKGELASLGVVNLEAVTAAGTQIQGRFAGMTADSFVAAAYDIKSGISTLSDEGVAAMTAAAATTAKATKAEVAQMTSLFATSYGIFKSQFKDMDDGDFGGMFGSSLAAAVQAFKTDGGKMQQALEAAGAMPTTIGMGMHEELAILGMLQQKMSAGESGTALRAFATQANKAHGELKKYGVAVMDTTGKLRPMEAVMGDLMRQFGGADGKLTAQGLEIIKKAWGTDEAMKVVTGLQDTYQSIEANADGLKEAAKNGLSYADAMAKITDTNLDSRLVVLNQRVDGFRGTIGKALVPILDRLLPKLDAVLGWVERFAAKNPKLVAGLVTAAAAVGGLLSVGGGLLSLLAGILGPLAMVKWAITTLGIKFGFLNAAMWANPIMLIIGALLALAAAAVLIWVYWDDLWAGFPNCIGIIESVLMVIGGFVDIVLNWFMLIPNAVSFMWSLVTGDFEGAMKKFDDWVARMLLPFQVIEQQIKKVSDLGSGALLEIDDTLSDWFGFGRERDRGAEYGPELPEELQRTLNNPPNLRDSRAAMQQSAQMNRQQTIDDHSTTNVTIVTQPGQDNQAIGNDLMRQLETRRGQPSPAAALYDAP